MTLYDTTTTRKMEKFKFIDLFCGIGGFHQAMTSLGGECVFACDIDEHCQATYYRNYGIMPLGDITKVDAADIPEHDVLCGGFPCQSFSIAGKRLGFADPTKGTLFFDIMRIVNYHHPKYLLLENVRNLASHDHGNTWRVIHQNLIDAGYNVLPEPVIFSPHYIGIPQARKRVFIMGVRKDIGELPEFYFDPHKAKPCSIDTVLQEEDEIKNVAKYRLKPAVIELIDLWNEFLKGIRPKVKKLPLFPVTDLFMHPTVSYVKNLDELSDQKTATIVRNVRLYNAAHEFIDEWLKKANTYRAYRGANRMLEWHAGNVENPDIWDTVIQFRQSGIRTRKPTHFPTLTAVLQTPYIGKRKRKLTPRECARLQSFPDTFVYDPKESQAYKQFGNSVNVEVVKLFARFMFGDAEVQEQYRKPTPEEFEAMRTKRKYTRRKPIELDENGQPRQKRKYVRHKPLIDENGVPIPQVPKRGPGRPRKVRPIIEGMEYPERKPKEPKPPREPKKRGRPRKIRTEEELAAMNRPKRKYVRHKPLKGHEAEFVPPPEDLVPKVKRKRGRPRKNPE